MANIYFARHFRDWDFDQIDGSTIEYPYRNRLVGIYFDDVESWAETDYGTKGQGRVWPSNILTSSTHSKVKRLSSSVGDRKPTTS